MKSPSLGDSRVGHQASGALFTVVWLVASILPSVMAAPASSNPFTFGTLVLHPNASYFISSSDGAQSRPGNPVKTTLQTATGGVSADLGKRWSTSYSASWSHYSSSEFSDAIDHSASLTGSDTLGEWAVHVAASYGSFSAPIPETGKQTKGFSIATSVGGSRHFSPNLSLELGLNRNFNFADEYDTGGDLGMNGRIHYSFSRSLDASIGTSASYVTKGSNPDQLALNPTAALSWRPSGKLSLSASAGAGYNNFSGPNGKSFQNPTYGLSLSYAPFVATSLSAGATRSIGRSYFDNQVSETTSWSLGFNQRLFRGTSLTASAGHSEVFYRSTTVNTPAGRNDGIDSLSFSLSTGILRRGSIALIYGRSHDASNRAGFSFTSTSVGARITYAY
jgi:hypothetical protein